MDGSGSMEDKRQTAQEAALRLARTLRAQDVAQVVQFNDRATVLQPFTHDAVAIEAAIRSTDSAGPTAMHTALYVAIKELQRDARSGQLRRRAIVLFTDGEDTASLVTDDQVLDIAKKSEVAIYAITLRSQRPQDRMRQAFSQAEYLMNALGRETGGHAYFPTALSELDSVYDRIALELRTLYAVGYASSNGRRDGKWRRIVVRVATARVSRCGTASATTRRRGEEGGPPFLVGQVLSSSAAPIRPWCRRSARRLAGRRRRRIGRSQIEREADLRACSRARVVGPPHLEPNQQARVHVPRPATRHPSARRRRGHGFPRRR